MTRRAPGRSGERKKRKKSRGGAGHGKKEREDVPKHDRGDNITGRRDGGRGKSRRGELERSGEVWRGRGEVEDRP